jgi:hypothetical protein
MMGDQPLAAEMFAPLKAITTDDAEIVLTGCRLGLDLNYLRHVAEVTALSEKSETGLP